ncbi:MAG: Gfo/Idh/MocA family oxidoreductase [Fimbriimonadaceae bacterium]|nr:Gfo/Idh/MocA family oxidoreductase [Fimbriimonadaceae bacterium]
MADPRTIRAGIIGYGGAFEMGRIHAEQMAAAGLQVTAVCDSDPARLALAAEQLPGVQTHLDHRLLLADPEIDLVVLILPHHLHAPVSIEASRAGKHVVVEKPMAVTTEEADAMIAAAAEAGRMLSIYHNRRWDGFFLLIRDLIRSGEIGSLVKLQFQIGEYRRPGPVWRADKRMMGSVLHSWGAHFIDWGLEIIPGRITGVFGHFRDDAWPEASVEDYGQALVRFDSGVVMDITIGTILSLDRPMWQVLGTRGSLSWHWGEPVRVKVDRGGRIADFELPAPQGEEGFAFYRNVADHLRTGAPLAVTAEEGRRVVAVLQAAERSHRSGRIEPV